MTDLIFVSLEDWDDIWRRNQFVVAGLARRYPAAKILFVGLSRDFSNRIRRGRLFTSDGEVTTTVPGLPNVTVTKPLKLLPNTLKWGRWLNERLMRRHVRKAAARLGMRRPLLWLNPQNAVHMVGRMGESATIYDITDDWTTLSQPDAVTRRVIADDAQLCRVAQATIVCSQRLFDMKRALTDRLHLIPNGVDAEHYASVTDRTLALPVEAQSWPRPVLGYTGTIHPDRVDVNLIQSVATRLTSGCIALVGPTALSTDDRARLTATGKVFLTGPVPYQRIPEYMRAFDVCITPHRVTPFTESLNPIKLWEYLAAGKPIVATDVAGFRDYPELVSIARDADEFLQATRAATDENPDKVRARRAEARRHSWASRLDAIEAVMNECEQSHRSELECAHVS